MALAPQTVNNLPSTCGNEAVAMDIINALNGVSPGTATPLSPLVPDANSNVAGINNLGFNGSLISPPNVVNSTGTTAASAASLSTGYLQQVNGTTVNAGVILPACVAGLQLRVFIPASTGTTTLVYAQGTTPLNGSADASASLAVSTGKLFIGLSPASLGWTTG